MPASRASLVSDLRSIGVATGDAVFVHAALRSVGPVEGGVAVILDALRDAVGPTGTILAYTDWEPTGDGTFEPDTSPAIPDNGWFPELLRTTPGARRSANPGASCAALGARADWFVADHSLNYGYGPRSPFGKLVDAGGKALMLGAPLDTMTLLHHAEHIADLRDKRVIRYDVPLVVDVRIERRSIEEFDTSDPVVAGFADDYFAAIVEAYLASGKGTRGTIGDAPSVLVDAAGIVPFAVSWMERAHATHARMKP
jgi:aminoglycoside 3-N-acetyltransferase